MAAKGLRREKVLASDVYQRIKEECLIRLDPEVAGCFEKKEVLAYLGYEAFGDSIRWDYLKEEIEQSLNCPLIGVIAAWFKSARSKDRQRLEGNWEGFLSGYGKPAAGFISVSAGENAQLAIARVWQRERHLFAQGHKFKQDVAAIREHASPPLAVELDKRNPMPRLEHGEPPIE